VLQTEVISIATFKALSIISNILCTNYFREVRSIPLFSWRGHDDIPALMRGRDFFLGAHEARILLFPVHLKKAISSIFKMIYVEESRLMDKVLMYNFKRHVTLYVR
jgi:hypothetical protein